MSTPPERLRRARIAAKFETSRAAAQAMGISEFTYNAHENGARGIKPDSAARYAKKFKVSEEWLLFGKGDGPGGDVDGPPTLSAEQLEPLVRNALLETSREMTNAEIARVVASALHDQLELLQSGAESQSFWDARIVRDKAAQSPLPTKQSAPVKSRNA